MILDSSARRWCFEVLLRRINHGRLASPNSKAFPSYVWRRVGHEKVHNSDGWYKDNKSPTKDRRGKQFEHVDRRDWGQQIMSVASPNSHPFASYDRRCGHITGVRCDVKWVKQGVQPLETATPADISWERLRVSRSRQERFWFSLGARHDDRGAGVTPIGLRRFLGSGPQ